MHQKQQDLPDNVELIHADVLKVDLADLVEPGKRLKIVANLPYSISSPFLFRLIDHAELMDFAVVMLQKEVAQRLTAQPGTKEYGAPTVLLAACATVQPLLSVHPAEFHPQPKVDSLVIRITFHPQSDRVRALGEFNRPLFTRIVHAAFGQRRKTLLNGLASGQLMPDKLQLSAAIEAAGISPSVRAETLHLEQFVTLTRTIDQVLMNSM
jgi:16S rRNA (adenine1518-N6/adenine1519-N6)-dimethyltransferase